MNIKFFCCECDAVYTNEGDAAHCCMSSSCSMRENDVYFKCGKCLKKYTDYSSAERCCTESSSNQSSGGNNNGTYNPSTKTPKTTLTPSSTDWVHSSSSCDTYTEYYECPECGYQDRTATYCGSCRKNMVKKVLING